MVHYSVIEKLRKQARVSYEDAKEALEMTEWDVLDAYVWLEARGKVGTVEWEEAAEEKVQADPAVEEKVQDDENLITRLLRMGRENRLVARSKRGRVGSLSIWGLVFVVLFFRKFAFFMFLFSLLMQVKYSFEGPDIKKTNTQAAR
ncbi:MAG: hypothetical protein IJB69_04950 [Clostridia bacterium]|nr:hypothetical protein [Clostridia bacterium]